VSTARHVPFAWQDKRFIRRILEQCEEPESAIGVYVALTVAASNSQREEFQTTHKWLAAMSGFSVSTVQRRLRDLERIEAVGISTPALKVPCIYRLLAFGNRDRTRSLSDVSFGHGPGNSVTEIRRIEEKNLPVTVTERRPAKGTLDFDKLRKEVALGPQT
jgi:hypothetical protein